MNEYFTDHLVYMTLSLSLLGNFIGFINFFRIHHIFTLWKLPLFMFFIFNIIWISDLLLFCTITISSIIFTHSWPLCTQIRIQYHFSLFLRNSFILMRLSLCYRIMNNFLVVFSSNLLFNCLSVIWFIFFYHSICFIRSGCYSFRSLNLILLLFLKINLLIWYIWPLISKYFLVRIIITLNLLLNMLWMSRLFVRLFLWSLNGYNLWWISNVLLFLLSWLILLIHITILCSILLKFPFLLDTGWL